MRLATCKRSLEKLLASLAVTDGHIGRFLEAFPRYAAWRIDRLAVAPTLNAEQRAALVSRGYLDQDLTDLLNGLRR